MLNTIQKLKRKPTIWEINVVAFDINSGNQLSVDDLYIDSVNLRVVRTILYIYGLFLSLDRYLCW
jgi:hypothetical protein